MLFVSIFNSPFIHEYFHKEKIYYKYQNPDIIILDLRTFTVYEPFALTICDFLDQSILLHVVFASESSSIGSFHTLQTAHQRDNIRTYCRKFTDDFSWYELKGQSRFTAEYYLFYFNLKCIRKKFEIKIL